MHKLSAMCVATVDKASITTLCVVRKTDFFCYYLKSGAESIPSKSFISHFTMTTAFWDRDNFDFRLSSVKNPRLYCLYGAELLLPSLLLYEDDKMEQM